MAPNRPHRAAEPHRVSTNHRLSILYAAVIVVIGVIILRLFYLQIIRHDHYRQAALNDQLKQYSIAADRGIIYAHQGDNVVPLVLNQKLFTLYADPTLVKDPSGAAVKLAAITGGDPGSYKQLLKARPSRYQVLAKRLSADQQKRILALGLPGVGLQAQDYRVYPQGALGANLLGFVDDSGQGRYGIEQQFNQQLAGQPGMLKAITDVNGVPLAASKDNVQKNPVAGDNIVLTIDTAMEQQVQGFLQADLKRVGAQSGCVVVLDPNTGSIKALVSYPTYDPSKYFQVTNLAAFDDLAVSDSIEVGSIMKTLTVSTGMDQGVITPNSTYPDPGYVTIDGSTIKNVLPIPEEPVTIKDVMRDSLNTGAVHVFKLLGGGQYDQQGRDILHDYLVNHFLLGRQTGVEQPAEAPGIIPNPDRGSALNLQYANTSFGQGMTATMLQMASAVSSVVNGGTYYRPHLVEKETNADGSAKLTGATVVKRNVVKPSTAAGLRELMEYVYSENYNVYSSQLHPGYSIGGKTGTAQIAINGGYSATDFNSTFVGFVGGDKPQYVVAVMVHKANTSQSEGAQAAAPVFGQIANMLINDFNVLPVSR